MAGDETAGAGVVIVGENRPLDSELAAGIFSLAAPIGIEVAISNSKLMARNLR
jgi:hypothetical protein